MEAVPLIVGYTSPNGIVVCLDCHRLEHGVRYPYGLCQCMPIHEGGDCLLFCEMCGLYLNNVVMSGPVYGGTKPIADQKAQAKEARRLYKEGLHG